MTEPTTPTRKARRKAMTDVGRQILQRQRQRLNREQAELGERLVNESRLAHTMGARLERQNDPVHNAVSRGIVRRVAGVLASEKVRPAIHVTPSDRFMAYTDFDNIVVNYVQHADKRVLAATLRGALYHEGGHIRWTMPFDDLRQVVIDATPDGLIYNAPITAEVKAYQWAWNALEDQRMETAVVSDSPRKAAYLTPMVMVEMIETPGKAAANWPLLIWRRYLPKHLRRGARKAFVAMHGDNGEALAQAFEAVTTQYVLATSHASMWDAVCQAVALFHQHQTAFSLEDAGHRHQRSNNNTRHEARKGDKLEIPVDPSMIDEDNEGADKGDDEATPSEVTEGETTDSEGAAQAEGDEGNEKIVEQGAGAAGGIKADDEGDESDEGEAAGGASTSESTEGETDKDGGEGAGGAAGTHQPKAEDDTLTQEDINEALAEAEAERLNDSAVEEDVRAFEKALNSGASRLPVYLGGVSGDVAAAAKAENLASQIEQAFQQATMDREPAWVEQQRRGIVNVNRYITRQPGEVEYFRNWVEDDQPGYNLAVSVLLDYSGSMSTYTKELAQVGYATKLACANLGIACTVTLWDNHAATLYDANEVPTGLPMISTNGSTNPATVLADLDNQRYDKEQHLVLLMTDGSWDHEWAAGRRGSPRRTVAHYAGQGRQFIGFGFSENTYTASSYASNLKRYGIAESYGITDLMAIPKRLQEALIRLV